MKATKVNEKEIEVCHIFSKQTRRIVYHNSIDNTIRVDKHIFSWKHFFEVNELITKPNKDYESS